MLRARIAALAGAQPQPQPLPQEQRDNSRSRSPARCPSVSATSRPASFALKRMLNPSKSHPREELPAGYPSSCWWAQGMRDAVATRWEAAHHKCTPRPLVVHSSCSGLASELIGCKVIGVPIGGCIAAERKQCAHDFMVSNLTSADLNHMFYDLQAQASGAGKCSRHGRVCSADTRRADILVGGPPCQPFTSMSVANRRQSYSQHPLYKVTFSNDEGFLGVIRATVPKAVLLEQVEGFLAPDAVTGIVPLKTFLDTVFAINDSAGKQVYSAAKVFFLNSGMWLTINRARIFRHSYPKFGFSQFCQHQLERIADSCNGWGTHASVWDPANAFKLLSL